MLEKPYRSSCRSESDDLSGEFLDLLELLNGKYDPSIGFQLAATRDLAELRPPLDGLGTLPDGLGNFAYG